MNLYESPGYVFQIFHTLQGTPPATDELPVTERTIPKFMYRKTKLFLWAGAIGWGISVLGVLLPWSLIEPMLLSMGMQHPVVDPQLHYWLRMATGGWTIIGFLFLMTALFPKRYENLLPLLAAASFFEGVVLLIYGLLLNRPFFPFYGDVGFCLVVGTGLTICLKKRN